VTLILTHIRNPKWAVQVADRLVSVSAVPYDRESNKSLVLLTDFAVAAIGYTGLSYIDGAPTDEWVAQLLWGERIQRGPTGAPAMSTFGWRKIPTVGPALQALAAELNAASQRCQSMRDYPVTLVVTGWLAYRRKPPRPFFCLVSPVAETKPTNYAVHWMAPRHFGNRHFIGICPNGYVTEQERKRLFIQLWNAESPNRAEELLVEQVRSVAARHPGTVGPDCMSISVSAPEFRQVVVEYLPASLSTAVLGSGARLPVSYTP
jgi:hypothetical protein